MLDEPTQILNLNFVRLSVSDVSVHDGLCKHGHYSYLVETMIFRHMQNSLSGDRLRTDGVAQN